MPTSHNPVIEAERRRKISLSRKGIPQPWNHGRPWPHEEGCSCALCDVELRRQNGRKGGMVNKGKKRKSPPSYIGTLRAKKISEAKMGHSVSPETRQKLSEAISAIWLSQSEETKLERAKLLRKGLHIKPNKPESKLLTLIEHHHLPFKYVGDGEVWLGRKNPDFININGKKQVIELLGIYWHSFFDMASLTEYYRQYGFACLLIWEDELKNERGIVRKLKQFACKAEGDIDKTHR